MIVTSTPILKNIEEGTTNRAEWLEGKVVSYDHASELYLLRYYDSTSTDDAEDEEQVFCAEALKKIACYHENEEGEEDDDAYQQGEDRPDSPLQVDHDVVDNTSLSPNAIEADETQDENDTIQVDTRDLEMEEEEKDLEEGMVQHGGGATEGDKRGVYPHWGTGGRYGNSQAKRNSKVKVNFENYGSRVTPVSNNWCTDIVQLYSPSTKFCCNKPSDKGFFAILWKLPLLLLGVFSAFTQAILSVVQTGTEKNTTDSDLLQTINKLVQGLEDYSSRVQNNKEVYARLEFTIAIDPTTIKQEAPPLPIIAETCPLPALEVVDAAQFKESFSRFVSLITTPLTYITRSMEHFNYVVECLSPEGKAALMCMTEMGVNTLGGGGVGKASALGNLLTSQKGTGNYSTHYLGPLENDLTKLNKRDYELTHLSFGLSELLVGFQLGATQSEAGLEGSTRPMTTNRSTVVLLSKSLKCPSAFLDCMQRVLLHMTGDLRASDITYCDQQISLLRPLKFGHIERYNQVQVTGLIRSIADLIVKLYRHEWAAILQTLFQEPPFTFMHQGTYIKITTKKGLEDHLATIRSTEDLRSIWASLACHRKKRGTKDLGIINKSGKLGISPSYPNVENASGHF